MAIWLVHPVGEADLGLDSQARQAGGRHDVHETRRTRDRQLQRLRSAIRRKDSRELHQLLVDGVAPADAGSDVARPPLPRTLAAILPDDGTEHRRQPEPIRLILLATRQPTRHPLDTGDVADVMLQALDVVPELFGVPVQRVDVTTVPSLRESDVLAGLALPLRGAAPLADRGIVTWGSGASSLALGAVTALVRARLRWSLVDVPDVASARLFDPLEPLPVDPVVALLVRWRMFPQLADLACLEPAPVRLDPRQRGVVAALARRWAQGHEDPDVDALRGLVADAVVRGDGTLGFAVRRYIWERYQELLSSEPQAQDLLAWAARDKPMATLGERLAVLDTARKEGQLRQELSRPSAQWLLSDTVKALNIIGRGSTHALDAVQPHLALKVARELRPGGEPVDAAQLRAVGLPAAPVVPGMTVFATWVVGRHRDEHRASLGAQLLRDRLGRAVRDHLAVSDQDGEVRKGAVTVKALLVATPQSADNAWAQRDELRSTKLPYLVRLQAPEVVVVPEPASGPKLSAEERDTWLANIVTQHMPSTVGAIVVTPSGPKDIGLALLRAARRAASMRGVPLFLRELTPAPNGGEVGTHLWPALTGGDLSLLVAARQAIESLELDVAWRLLAATSVADPLGTACRQLTNAVTCRLVHDPDAWPSNLPGPLPDRGPRTTGLLAERLRLVRSRLESDADAATRVRHLMLAAGAVEVTVGRLDAREDGSRALRSLRKQLSILVRQDPDPSRRLGAATLLVLDGARNGIAITHGAHHEPDAAIHDAVLDVSREFFSRDQPLPSLREITNVPNLLDAAIDAAGQLFTQAPGSHSFLCKLYYRLIGELNGEIGRRGILAGI